MINSNNQISNKEAAEALETLKSTKIKSTQSFRAPLWFNFLISLSIGIFCFAAPLTSDNSLWTSIALVSAAVMFIGLAAWGLLLRKRGVKQNIVPVGLKGRVLTIIQAILSGLVIVGSIELYKHGHLWTPYASGAIHTIFMSYVLYHFPTGEWT